MSITKAFMTYFGKNPASQPLSEFSAEIKKATANPADRQEWVRMFATVGIDCSEAS